MAMRRGALLLFGTLMAITALSTDLYVPAMPAVGRAFGASAAAVQFTLSAFLAGIGLGQLVYGPVSDRFGRKIPLCAGLAIFTAASVGCALAPQIEALVGLRFLQAIGACACAVLARAATRDLVHVEDLARTFSALMLIMGMVPILAPLAGGYLLLGFGWRAIFWVHAIVGAACLAAVAYALPESLPPDRRSRVLSLRSATVSYGELLRDRHFIAPALGLSFTMAGIFIYFVASPHLFIDGYGLSAQAYGWIFAVNAAGTIGASQLNRLLLRRYGPSTIMAASLGASVAAALALTLVAAGRPQSPLAVLVPLFAFAAAAGFVLPNASAAGLAQQAERAGSAAALMGVAQFVSGASLSALYAALGAESALAMATAILACSTAGALAYRLIAPRAGPSRLTASERSRR